jgi:hypothetical protein
MFRLGLAFPVVAVILLSSADAKAQWFSNWWDGMHRDYRRNVAWPEPFLKADREAVNLPIGMMVANGWRKQNLLSDYHFNEGKPQLNQAGELKLYFILTQMPPNRRTVFVQRAMDPDVTATRIALVQRAASRMLPGGMIADVVESDLPSDGWPADEIDAVTRKFRTTQPDPRLKAASQSGDGSGGGSGN